jgi:N-hydroxyarylamine O-acetyltransferase
MAALAPLTVRAVDEYLDRIGTHRPDEPDRASLARLQLAHLETVPFENLDIARGVPIVTELAAVADKVVRRRRGGYCFEVNALFGSLLTSLGYEVRLLAARVARDDGTYGRPFAHLALDVVDPDGGPSLLTDVAFGDGLTAPLPIVADVVSLDRDRRVRLVRDGDGWVYEDDRHGTWAPLYTFDLVHRSRSDFDEMNRWQQTSPESRFTQQTICTRLTPEGRITIAGDRLIVTTNSGRDERTLADGERDVVLRDRFGIVLDRDALD